MKITVPENISDITLGQSQKYERMIKNKDLSNEEFLNELVSIFSNVSKDVVSSIVVKDKLELQVDIIKALETECEYKNRFHIGKQEFGMIPNFDKITGNEYTDLQKYQEHSDDLHRLFAILYRPITKTDKSGNYQIEDYVGTSTYSELMKQTPMNIVHGCLGFFLSLSKTLDLVTLRSIHQEHQRVAVL
tara:strand:- start:25719 stop:26285 length:567 start_codon:yes stop_codon:yes gene_type:complete